MFNIPNIASNDREQHGCVVYKNHHKEGVDGAANGARDRSSINVERDEEDIRTVEMRMLVMVMVR